MKMTAILSLLTALLLSLGTAFAQNCTSVINDETGLLTSSDTSTINQAANVLLDHGVLPKVVFAAHGNATNMVEARYEAACPNWKVNGSRAANLLTFIVIPSAHIKNVYFGGALTPAFGGAIAVNNRFSQAANPYFRQGQWGNGIAQSMKDFGAAIAAYHDQAQHPVQHTTQVTEQATDLSPVASVFKVLFGLLFLGALIGLVVWFIRRRGATQEDNEAAQQSAQAARNRATTLYRAAQLSDSSQPGYTEVSSQYLDLSQSVSYDPNTMGLSAAIYTQMANVWDSLSNDIKALRNSNNTSSDPSAYDDPTPPSYPRRAYAATASTPSHASRVSRHTEHVAQPAPRPVATRTVIHHETVIDRSSSNNDLVTGVILGEALSNRNDRNDRYDRPSYSEPERDRESSGSDSSWGTSSSDSSSSGSDSSWGDSSSSSDFSSSDSGSGSDSSW